MAAVREDIIFDSLKPSLADLLLTIDEQTVCSVVLPPTVLDCFDIKKFEGTRVFRLRLFLLFNALLSFFDCTRVLAHR